MKQKFLSIWFALLLGAVSASAKDAYVYYMSSDHSLNFCFDDNKKNIQKNYTVYSLNIGSNEPAWYSIRTQVEELYFYPSSADYKPTSCYMWAANMKNLVRVMNISYLNTSNVANMEQMFDNCSALTSLDVSGFNTANVTTMAFMFYNCYALISLDLNHISFSSSAKTYGMMKYCTSLKTLKIPSTANIFASDACDGVGTTSSPCTLDHRTPASRRRS